MGTPIPESQIMQHPLSDFLHDTTYSDIPEDARRLARQWMLDLIGVAAGGQQTSLSRIIRNHAARQFGGSGAQMLFDGREVSPAGAALAGGMTIDALDGHDGHKLTKGHVGCGIFPSLLALCQAEKDTEAQHFLTSLVIGYEIGTRAGIALHRTAPDYHTSGAWIAVAVAALGARVLRLDAARTREAMGIAEYHGPRSQMMRTIDHPTMVKDGSGWGAMSGVSAVYLAKDGFTGAPAVTVEHGDVADLWSDLGQTWRIREQYFKHFPVCRWAQPALQAVLNLRADHDLTSHDVDRIEITTFHESRRLAVTDPRTTEEAQYSTAFPTAVGMVRGTCGPKDMQESSFAEPEIQRLAHSMDIRESDTLNAAFPARRIAEVTLVLKDGRELNSGPTEALGDPEDPATLDTVVAKFHAYADPLLGAERANTIEDHVLNLGTDSGDDMSLLLSLLTAPV
ncbi:2-methylcitrate dehydratase PrpD [Marivita geojedonensis]|nr:2-methylcitrate dehydratase PrpD [Marivita geojedonensis]